MLVMNNRRSLWRLFKVEAIGVGLLSQVIAVARLDLELVNCAFSEPWNEKLPDPGAASNAHGVSAAIPAIEVSNDTDAPGVGSPDRELHATHVFKHPQVGSELFILLVVITFTHQVQVKVRKNWREGVGVDELKGLISMRLNAQLVAVRQRLAFKKECKETFGADLLHSQRRLRPAFGNDPGLQCLRQESTNSQSGGGTGNRVGA